MSLVAALNLGLQTIGEQAVAHNTHTLGSNDKVTMATIMLKLGIILWHKSEVMAALKWHHKVITVSFPGWLFVNLILFTPSLMCLFKTKYQAAAVNGHN